MIISVIHTTDKKIVDFSRIAPKSTIVELVKVCFDAVDELEYGKEDEDGIPQDTTIELYTKINNALMNLIITTLVYLSDSKSDIETLGLTLEIDNE